MEQEKKSKPGRTRKAKQKLVYDGGPVHVNTGPILDADDPSMYNELVLVGGAACDWVTLTTGDTKEYQSMLAYTVAPDTVRRLPIREAKRMQYQGWAGDCWFVGEARQDGSPHYMMQAWGARAQECLRYALMFHEGSGLVKCTRMDLQVTSERSFAGDLPAVAEVLRTLDKGEWAGRGPRPKVSYFSSDSLDDTMYIGSRSAARMWRFYNKKVNGELFLRVELEAKKWLAERIWQDLQDIGLFHVKHAFEREFMSLPQVAREVAEELDIIGDRADRYARPVVDRDALLATQRWLMEVVLPSFEKILVSEVGAKVRAAYLRVLGVDNER